MSTDPSLTLEAHVGDKMNTFNYTLPPDLCFPTPPFRIDVHYAEVNRKATASFQAAIRSWRLRSLEVLRNAGAKELSEVHFLSLKAQETLAVFLASGWTTDMTAYAAQSPYNMRAFPSDVLEPEDNSSRESVLEVLQWRAGIMDYLGDAPFAWMPALDLDECVAIGRFFNPDGHKKLCGFCLTEFTPEQIHPDSHECALTSYVRAEWPHTPSAFRAWARKAKESR